MIASFLNNSIQLKQPENGFKTSLDSVLLGALVPSLIPQYWQADDPRIINNPPKIFDLGCGVGGAGFCALTRHPYAVLTGIDIADEYIALANENRDLNPQIGDRAQFIHDNAVTYCKSIQKPHYDCVITNPPFYEGGAYIHAPNDLKNKALGFIDNDITLHDWIMAATYVLKPRGYFCMVHRADMLHQIIIALGNRYGDIEIFPIHPFANIPAKRVLIRARKGRKSGTTIHPGLTLHERQTDKTDKTDKDQPKYSLAAEKILRDGCGF